MPLNGLDVLLTTPRRALALRHTTPLKPPEIVLPFCQHSLPRALVRLAFAASAQGDDESSHEYGLTGFITTSASPWVRAAVDGARSRWPVAHSEDFRPINDAQRRQGSPLDAILPCRLRQRFQWQGHD